MRRVELMQERFVRSIFCVSLCPQTGISFKRILKVANKRRKQENLQRSKAKAKQEAETNAAEKKKNPKSKMGDDVSRVGAAGASVKALLSMNVDDFMQVVGPIMVRIVSVSSSQTLNVQGNCGKQWWGR
jgi:hypothetical protein